MTSEGWRDPRIVEAARAGIQTARAALDVKFPITWDRKAKVYRAGGFEFDKWSEASEWVLAQDEGEQ